MQFAQAKTFGQRLANVNWPAWRAEYRAFWPLAVPLALVQLGSTLTGMVDTAIAGRGGELPLAATGMGSAIFLAGSVLGLGCGYGADPLISQAVGRNEKQAAYRWLWQGIYLALLASLPLWGLCHLTSKLLPALGVEQALADASRTYLRGRLPSLPPFCLVAVLRAYLQAMGRTRPILMSTVVMNLFNAAADWALMFGDAGLVRLGLPAVGLPAMGIFGLGIASTLATVLQACLLGWAIYAHADARPPAKLSAVPAPDPTALRRLLRLGLPAGSQVLAEVGVFSLVSLLAGSLGVTAMASHQAALMLVSCTFGACLGVGAATTVRVGRAIGRRDTAAVRRGGLVGLQVGVGLMSLSSLAMLLVPETLMRLMTHDPQVVHNGAKLIRIAAFFQLADGVQAVLAGALRGAGITRFPFLVNIVAHWGMGVPVALALTFLFDFGVAGLWWGLTLGLVVVSGCLWLRFVRMTRTAVATLEV